MMALKLREERLIAFLDLLDANQCNDLHHESNAYTLEALQLPFSPPKSNLGHFDEAPSATHLCLSIIELFIY